MLQVLDVPPLLRRAQHEDITIEFRARPGQALVEHGVVAVVHGHADAAFDHDILAGRNLDLGRVPDEIGILRVRVPMRTWDDFVAVALDEIIATPTNSIHLRRRVRQLLEQLTELVPPEGLRPLQTRLDRLPA